MRERLEALQADYVIIAIPLLLEKQWQNEVDRILVVDADEQLQIKRTITRDNISPEAVSRIMRTQVSRQERLAAADDIIHNNGEREALKEQVQKLHRHYLHLVSISHDG